MVVVPGLFKRYLALTAKLDFDRITEEWIIISCPTTRYLLSESHDSFMLRIYMSITVYLSQPPNHTVLLSRRVNGDEKLYHYASACRAVILHPNEWRKAPDHFDVSKLHDKKWLTDAGVKPEEQSPLLLGISRRTIPKSSADDDVAGKGPEWSKV